MKACKTLEMQARKTLEKLKWAFPRKPNTKYAWKLAKLLKCKPAKLLRNWSEHFTSFVHENKCRYIYMKACISLEKWALCYNVFYTQLAKQSGLLQAFTLLICLSFIHPPMFLLAINPLLINCSQLFDWIPQKGRTCNIVSNLIQSIGKADQTRPN